MWLKVHSPQNQENQWCNSQSKAKDLRTPKGGWALVQVLESKWRTWNSFVQGQEQGIPALETLLTVRDRRE